MGIEIGMPVDEAIEILDKRESDGDIDEWHMREDLALLIAVDSMEIVIETVDGEIWEVVAIRIYE